MDFNLLEKTELWVNEISLEGANLTEMANTVAKVLGMSNGQVMVVDVRPRHITFDLLVREIPAQQILGKQAALLDALSAIPGVFITEDTYIHSNGILGLIASDDMESLDKSREMAQAMRQKISRRAIVFPTGFEVSQGMIEDTNTPYLEGKLKEMGFTVTLGRVIEDSMDDFFFCLSDAISRGFGLILTTGGVGAEDKDFSVEAVLRQDPQAAVSYIVKFTKGTGRHVKDGVRIAVGQVGLSYLVTLPGPHDEVQLAWPILKQGIEEAWSKQELAEKLAKTLGDKWKYGHNH